MAQTTFTIVADTTDIERIENGDSVGSWIAD